MIKSLTFVSSNASKAKQLQEYLSVPINHKELDLPEIQSLDLQEIILFKAKEAFRQIGSPVLVDDVAVQCKALGGLPGPYIKWFMQALTPEGFCNLMKQYKDKSAMAISTIGLFDGNEFHMFEGKVKGRIADRPIRKKSLGFGWDVFFIPDKFITVRGELSKEDYDKTSPRKKAVKKLEKFLLESADER